MEDKPHIATFDIECGDSRTIVGIGSCIGDLEGNVAEVSEWHVKVPEGYQPDPRCKAEFWDKFPGLWEYFQKDGKDPSIVSKDFVEYLDSIESRLGIKENKISFAQDNPGFDIGNLNAFTAPHRPLTIQYTSKNEYRWTSDYSDVAWFLGLTPILKRKTDSLVKHDHKPSNDATNIYYQHVFMEKLRNKIPESMKLQLASILEGIELDLKK